MTRDAEIRLLHALAAALAAECAAEKISRENEVAFIAWCSRVEARVQHGGAGAPDEDEDAAVRHHHSRKRYDLAKRVTVALVLAAQLQDPPEAARAARKRE